MTMRKGKVFIDANIIKYATDYQKMDVFSWINALYEEIYIHQSVLEELVVTSLRQKAEEMLQSKQWKLFNPDEESTLSDELFPLYESYVKDVRNSFRQLDEKKQVEGRPLKHTNDIGEIHSLAAAMILSANIICSNDFDIREVIEDAPIMITIDEEKDSILIEQDTLEDFCFYVVKFDIAKIKIVRKFFKSIQPNKLEQFEQRIKLLNETTSRVVHN
jgi:rRNA-processing protein FCF1